MNRYARNAGAMSSSPVFLTLIITFVLGFVIGFFFCYAWLSPRAVERTAGTKAPAPAPVATPKPGETPSGEGVLAELRPGRHLFLGVDGKDLSAATVELLGHVRPGGIVLRPDNVESPEQASRLVVQIKKALGGGTEAPDLPLIAGDPDELGKVLSAEPVASLAELVAARDTGRALATGKAIAAAFQAYGIRVAFAPSLASAADLDTDTISSVGLAYAEGLAQGGVLPVVKGYPGVVAEGAAASLPQDVTGLAKRFLPFTDALAHGVPGIRVEHVAVPALDLRYPDRPASLSPVLVRRLLRSGEKPYRGVILADDLAAASVSARYRIGDAVVEALGAGCDAAVLLDTDAGHVRDACAAVARAVQEGLVSRQQLDESKQRLDAWQEWIKAPKSLEGPLPDLQPLNAGAEQTPTTPPAPVEAAPVEAAPPVEQTPVAPPAEAEKVEEAPAPSEAVAPAPAEAPAAEQTPEQPKAETEAPKVEATAPEPEAAAPKAETQTEAPTEAAPPGTERIVYSIQQGDRLFRIAKRFGVKPEEIVKWNDLKDQNIKFGRKLVIYTTKPDAGAISGAGTTSESPVTPPVAAVEPAAAAPAPEVQPVVEVPTAPAPAAPAVPVENTAPAAPAAAPAATPAAAPEAPAPESTVPEEEAPSPAGVPTVTSGVKDGLVRVEHEVLRGEILSRIATQYAVKQSDVVKWNKLSNPNVQRGQRLVLYVEPGVAERGGKAEEQTPAAPPAAVEAPAPEASAPAAPAPVPSAPAAVAEGGAETYRVQAGDTASSLARKYGVSVSELLRLNGIDNPDRILVGQKIKVPRRG